MTINDLNVNLSDIRDLNAGGITTPWAQDIYETMTRLAVTHGKRLTFDAIRAHTKRNNKDIHLALRGLERAGLIIIDDDCGDVTLVY